jgi:probable phosphoglycerate mutase
MPGDGTRTLYLARHAEPDADGSGITARGARQAEHLGRRLSHLALSRIVHGPLPRAAETARVVAEQFVATPQLSELDVAGDYLPHVPRHPEVPAAWADTVLSSFDDVSEREALEGASLGADAIDLFAGAARGDQNDVEVVITHAFTIGWLVRRALDAPSWRWWGQNQCHAGLTVIRYRVHGPPSILVANDVAHLPAELRWTGFPDEHKP